MRRPTHAREALLATLLTCVFAVGFVGQGHFRIGARPASVAVSAAAVEVVGGAGTHPPVNVIVQVTVVNQGSDTVRVEGAVTRVFSAVPLGIDPRVVEVKPGRVGRVNVLTLLDCRTSKRFQLPDLRISLPDAARRTIPIGGSGRLTEACTRAGPTLRPITTTTSIRDGENLTLHLSSPTTRPIRVLAVRAGAVRLGVAGLPQPVTQDTELRLSPPPACPKAWLAAGVPGSLTLDTDDGTPAPATLQLKVGAALTDWLLSTTCPEPS